jgi:hypothetical protein
MPVQLRVMDATSDEEMELIAEVEFLQSQLKKDGDPVDGKFSDLFLQTVESEPLAERIKRWRFRKNQLQIDFFVCQQHPCNILRTFWLTCRRGGTAPSAAR